MATPSAPNGSGPLSTSQVLDAVAQFEALSTVIVENFEVLAPDHAHDAYKSIEKARKRLAVIDATYVETMKGRMPSAEHRKIAWLAQEMRISRAEARQRINVVGRLSRNVDPFAPANEDVRMPNLRQKVEEGVVGADAVSKIDKAVRELPATEHAQLSRLLDKHIADLVDKIRVDDLNKLPNRLRAMLGVDDPYTDEDRARKRSLKIGAQGPDGMSRLSGVVTPSFAAVLKRLQADHARPGGLLEEGADDQRNPEQRFHDAMEAAVNGGFQPGGDLQPARGTTSVVTVAHIADVAALAGVSLPDGKDFVLPGSGKAVSDAGVRISISQAVQQMVDRNSFLQVLGNEGQTLYFGRSRRLGTLPQYLALLGEEGGSSAPGMGTPGAMCDVHHVQSWSSGGGTDLDNLTLVDPGTHRKIDDARCDENAWWTLRPDEVPGILGTDEGDEVSGECEPVSTDRVVWVAPKGKEGNRKAESNEDPDTFDSPGRWLRRKAREKRAGDTADGNCETGQDPGG